MNGFWQAEANATHTCCLSSQFQSFHGACFNKHSGIKPLFKHTFPSLSLCLAHMSVLRLFMRLCSVVWVVFTNAWRISHDPLCSVGAKHAGIQVAAKGRLSSRSWLAPSECALCLCVYCELMCTLVFLRLQTHRQPVLANGIYGKKFTWYYPFLTKNGETLWHSGKGFGSFNIPPLRRKPILILS